MATETTKAKEPELVAVNPNEDGSKGLVQVSPTVIASIVKKYALAVDGVLRLAPQSIGAGIADVFSRRTYERSLNLAFSENGVEIHSTRMLCRSSSVVGAARPLASIQS